MGRTAWRATSAAPCGSPTTARWSPSEWVGRARCVRELAVARPLREGHRACVRVAVNWESKRGSLKLRPNGSSGHEGAAAQRKRTHRGWPSAETCAGRPTRQLQRPGGRGAGRTIAHDGPTAAHSTIWLQAAEESPHLRGLGCAVPPNSHPSSPQCELPAPPTPSLTPPTPPDSSTPPRTPPGAHMVVISSLLCTYDSVPATMVPAMSTPSSGWMTTPQMDSHASRRTSLWDA